MPRRVAENRTAGERSSGAGLGDRAEARRRETPNAPQHRDPVYLFACHLEWRDRGSVKAYQELVAALDDCNQEIRAVAETLLHRSSPRSQIKNAAKKAQRSGGNDR